MVPIPVTPRLALILLLLLGAGVGWYLATSAGDQRWLAFVAAWAGASAGILAMPLFEFLGKPLPNPLDRPNARSATTMIASLVLIQALRLLLITGFEVGEVIAKGFLCGFLPSAFFGVQTGAYPGTRWLEEKLLPPAIFISTVLFTNTALNVFATVNGIARVALVLTGFGALIYATAQVQFCIAVWIFRPPRNYSAFQSLQILALIFGIGLSFGGVTSWLR